jgi:hypothetical protein
VTVMRSSTHRLILLLAVLLTPGCEDSTPNLTAPPPPPPPAATPIPGVPADLAITCDKPQLDLDEAPGGATCTVRPTNGFRGIVRLSCSGLPAEMQCTFSPAEVNITGTSSVVSSVSVTRTIMADPGRTTVQVVAEGGDVKRTADLAVNVNPACAGFFRRATFSGNCSDGAPHWRCIEFSDGYKWHLVPTADIRGYTRESCFGMAVESTDNAGAVRYRHVLGTNLITTVGSIYR